MDKSFEGLQEAANHLAEEVMLTLPRVSADKLGLDVRAGWAVYVGQDFLAIKGNTGKRMIDYYGGFEYIDADYRMSVGDWTIYSDQDARVRSCLDHFRGEPTIDEEDE